MPPKSPPRPNRPGRLGASAGAGSTRWFGFNVNPSGFLDRFRFRVGRRGCWLPADRARPRLRRRRDRRCRWWSREGGLIDPAARAALQVLDLDEASFTTDELANGRPAGKPYMAGAEADGLASTETGFLETRIMPAPGKSACSVCPTASPSGLVCSAVSAAGSAGSVGAGAASCAAGGRLGNGLGRLCGRRRGLGRR